MHAFKINVNNQELVVRPLQEKDQILYEIYADDLLCVIGLNENAEWEANNDYDASAVRKIGNAIEDNDYSENEFDIADDPQPDDVDIP
jgi:hypothetical protein